jgi:hypothetical protein
MSAIPATATTTAATSSPGSPASEEALAPATWRDPKRYAWLLGLLIPTLPFLSWGLVHATGLGLFWFYGPILVFGVFPPLDLALGIDARNPPDSVIKWLEQDRYYRWCTYLYLPIQYAGLVFACWLWSHGHLSTLDSIGLALTVAMVSGIAINTAHELGHKRASIERWLSRVALAQSGYGHFYIEHNRGHHVRVATPEDPASARLGESFYAFLPRTVLGSVRSAWALERTRLARLGSSPWSSRNDILGAWAMTVVLFAALVAGFGLLASTFTRSQIAALFVTIIGTMIPAIQFAGMLNPVSSLEGFGAFIGRIYPASHFLTISRGVFSKALGFSGLQAEFWPLLLAVPVILGVSIVLLKKQET